MVIKSSAFLLQGPYNKGTTLSTKKLKSEAQSFLFNIRVRAYLLKFFASPGADFGSYPNERPSNITLYGNLKNFKPVLKH